MRNPARHDWRPPARGVEVADAVGRNDVGQPPAAIHDVAHAGVVQAVDLGAEVEADLGPFLEVTDVILPFRSLRFERHRVGPSRVTCRVLEQDVAEVEGPNRSAEVEQGEGGGDLVRTELMVGP